MKEKQENKEQLLLVKRNLRQKAKYAGRTMNVSKEFFEAFEKEVQKKLEKACMRAQLNGRSTIMAKDI